MNGKTDSLELEMPLLRVLRDELNLPGTKLGCGIAQCGACTVHVYGQAVRSCVTPVGSVSGAVTTVEGPGTPATLHAVQAAWVECQVQSAVAAMSGWGQPLVIGRGRGLAFHLCRGVPVAQVIEITTSKEGVKIDRVFAAADVGAALDPRKLEAQVQSGVIFGLSSAVYGQITFAKGAAEQSSFHDDAMLCIRQAPQIAVKVLEGGSPIRGVGETGVPPVAPALANAIFHATGKRIRELPLRRQVDFV